MPFFSLIHSAPFLGGLCLLIGFSLIACLWLISKQKNQLKQKDNDYAAMSYQFQEANLDLEKHIMELDIMKTEIEKSNEELKQFCHIASHDLQEPLRKVINFGDFLQEEAAEKLTEEEKVYIQKMRSASQRMSRLIQSLLEYSRVGTKELKLEMLDLNEIIEEVSEDLEIRISETKGEIKYPHLPEIKGDYLRIKQLFQNLIGNGLKYHRLDQAPIINIKTQKISPNLCSIEVQDNGIGFDPSQSTRVFQPFTRLETKDKYEGTGIGLAICDKIVKLHNGKIEAFSEPGKGSTFKITLPITEGDHI